MKSPLICIGFEQVKGVLSVEHDHIIHLDDPVRPKPVDR